MGVIIAFSQSTPFCLPSKKKHFPARIWTSTLAAPPMLPRWMSRIIHYHTEFRPTHKPQTKSCREKLKVAQLMERSEGPKFLVSNSTSNNDQPKS